jgi:hypothetical protein
MLRMYVEQHQGTHWGESMLSRFAIIYTLLSATQVLH